MSLSEQNEIDRIVSELADEGSSSERFARLDQLLHDRPDLQQHYSQAMALHVLLDFEFDLSMQQLQPIVAPQSRDRAAVVDHCEVLSTRIDRDISTYRAKSRHSWRHFAAIAAMLLVAVGLWSLTRSLPAPPTAVKPVEAGQLRTNDGAQAKPGEGLVVRDAQALRTLSELTRTPSLTSLMLPRSSMENIPGVTLCNGTAWMHNSPTQRERGYVVALQPGYRMDLYVYTDALYQNSLGVVELDDTGHMTGGALSFSNLEKGDLQTARRRLGCIGNYSEFNDRSTPRYYLFTGSHLPPQQRPDEPWRLSDFKVQFDSGDVMAIGWDDSGYLEGSTDYAPDRDYNDVRALVRFSRPGGAPTTTGRTSVSYSPEIEQDMPLAANKGSGFSFDVRPGETLSLLISSSADMQNSIRVVDDDSRKIIWQDDGSPSNSPKSQASDRGVYVIRNSGPTVKRYEIQAQHIEQYVSGRQAWEVSPYQVFADGDRSVVVGFEDSVTIPANVDWNDIRVYARWFSE